MSRQPKGFVEKRQRRWCFTDLVTDGKTGRLVEAKLWSNVGKASALSWFSWECYAGHDSEWLWLVVMGILTAHEVFVRLLSARSGAGGAANARQS
jgi:hypothetical protein